MLSKPSPVKIVSNHYFLFVSEPSKFPGVFRAWSACDACGGRTGTPRHPGVRDYRLTGGYDNASKSSRIWEKDNREIRDWHLRNVHDTIPYNIHNSLTNKDTIFQQL